MENTKCFRLNVKRDASMKYEICIRRFSVNGCGVRSRLVFLFKSAMNCLREDKDQRLWILTSHGTMDSLLMTEGKLIENL